MKLASTCGHTAPTTLERGILVCGRCLSPILAEGGAGAEVSTVNLPIDCKSADVFNRRCRHGDVAGARKVGRVWICTLDAWNARSSAKLPAIREARRTKAVARPHVDALLAQLGGERRAG